MWTLFSHIAYPIQRKYKTIRCDLWFIMICEAKSGKSNFGIGLHLVTPDSSKNGTTVIFYRLMWLEEVPVGWKETNAMLSFKMGQEL